MRKSVRYAQIFSIVSALTLFLSSCGNDRGGVIVDASGEQGGGTQPGGGGFAFVILFLVVASCTVAMFTMDRIKKNKSQGGESSPNDTDQK